MHPITSSNLINKHRFVYEEHTKTHRKTRRHIMNVTHPRRCKGIPVKTFESIFRDDQPNMCTLVIKIFSASQWKKQTLSKADDVTTAHVPFLDHILFNTST